jgi:ATP-dependent Lhr-like helicase
MASDAPGRLTYLNLPPSPETALTFLAEPMQSWFRSRYGQPTLAQRHAWAAISGGANLFLCSPTGSGKTLAAMLPIVSRLLLGPGQSGCRCLYIVPLKALGNDIRKTLSALLAELTPGLPPDAPCLQVGLRTGDTSSDLRKRQLQCPPEILITTPESLALLLTQPAALEWLTQVRWVVVDELHSLAPTKRGADLTLSLERLDDLVRQQRGERASFQRIGLSATCAPLATAPYVLVGMGRSCSVVQIIEEAGLNLSLEPLPPEEDTETHRRALDSESPFPPPPSSGFLAQLVRRLEPELLKNRTTLVFTNTRSLAERLTWALRRRHPRWTEQIGVHHSSLSAPVRREVESKLKAGSLRVAISSTTLELGIDIGSVDGVVLVHPPGGVVRLLQRIGRAGHSPGRSRRGLVLTSTPAELLEAVVTGSSGHLTQIEPLAIPEHPLDVLCQQLLGMAACGWWPKTEAFDLVRRAYPYRELSLSDFEACLHYLSGQHADGREWLPPRIRWEGECFTLVDAATLRILRRNLGTILTDEPRPVRLQTDPGRLENPDAFPPSIVVGEVENSFAERLQPGDRFLLDGRCLEYRRREAGSLLVEEVSGKPLVPRWDGSGWPLSAELARRIFLFRSQAAEALREGPLRLACWLCEEFQLQPQATRELVNLFALQEAVSEIPEPGLVLVEMVPNQVGIDYYLHTSLNRAGNEALARVAGLRLTRDRGWAAFCQAADLGLLFSVRQSRSLSPDAWRELLSLDGFADDFDRAVEESDLYRERFQQVAYTGLMLLRNPLGRRRRVGGRDWAERCLFDQVKVADPEFVLLRQAHREIRRESCDLEAALDYVGQLRKLTIRCRCLSRPSPLAESWTQAAQEAEDAPRSPQEALQDYLHDLAVRKLA